MNQQKEFLTLLSQAFTSTSTIERDRANSILSQQRLRDPDSAVLICLSVMESDQVVIPIRVLTMTYLTGCLIPPEDSPNPTSVWFSLNPQTKIKVKETSLILLNSSEQSIMKSAASFIATLFALDCLTEKSWTDLLSTLSQNVDSMNMIVKISAMTTLGLICDILNKKKITSLSNDQVDMLLTGICKGLKELDDLTDTAVQAFDDSVHFLHSQLNNEKICDFIMQLLVTLFRKIHQNRKDSESERTLIYCLMKIAKKVFRSMSKYSDILYDEILGSYSRNSRITIACNEFFHVMARMELKYKTNYLRRYWSRIMEVCLNSLLSCPFNDDDEEESGGSMSSSILDTMTSINKLYFHDTFDVMKNFVQKYIEEATDQSKFAALIVFESLIESQETPELKEFLNSGFFGVLSFLQTGSPAIRKHSSRFVLKIGRFHPDIIFHTNNFRQATSTLIKIMETTSNNDTIRTIQSNTAQLFSELTKSAQENSRHNSAIKTIIQPLFDSIFKTTLYTNDTFIIDSYFSIIFDFIQRVIEPRLLGEHMIESFEFLKSVDNSQNSQKALIYEFIFINMNLMLSLISRNQVSLFSSSKKNSTDFLIEVFTKIISIFECSKKVISDGIPLMANILTTDQNGGNNDINGFLETYVLPALKDPEATDVFKSAIEALSICVKKFPDRVSRYAPELFPYLISLLNSNDIQKELKISLLYSVSDLVIHQSSVAKQNIAIMIEAAETNMKTVVNYQNSSQEDLNEFAEIFKETIIEFYLCLTHIIYLNMNECDRTIEQSMARVSEFIEITIADNLNPSIHYLTSCLGLQTDFFSKKRNFSLININVIRSLFKILEKVRDVPDVASTIDFAKQYFYDI